MGGQPAPDGVYIQARVKWWRSNTDSKQSQGKVFNGNYTSISVTPNDWALQGETVTFHLGGSQAAETAIYNGNSFAVTTLNLTFP